MEITNYGDTALMHAAASGKGDTVEFLLKNKADVDLMNFEGVTALIFSTFWREAPTVV
jgi:ankyrin repeat protein